MVSDLHFQGEVLTLALAEQGDISGLLIADRKELLVMAASLTTAPTLEEGLALILSHLAASGELSDQSFPRIAQVLGNFTTRSVAQGLVAWDGDLTQAVCTKFIHARTSQGKPPSVSLMHLRRSVLRIAFRSARFLAFWDGDPTLDVLLPARSPLTMRPVADDELALMHQAAGMDDYWYTRQPTVVALLESGLSTGEVPLVLIDHIDDPEKPSVVRTAGTHRTNGRDCELTDWAQRIVKTRVKHLRANGATGTTPLAYEGNQVGTPSPQASICGAARSVIRRAELGRERDLKPRSITAWAGRRTFEQTGDLPHTARSLGLRSLDATAQFIGLAWKDQP